MKLNLVRFGYLADCTLGWLYVNDFRLATIEDPWRPDPDGPGGQRRDGALAESCIPDGLYKLERHSGTVQKDTWSFVNHGLGVYHWPDQIPTGQKYGRSACLIHSGNSADAVLGCVAVGLTHTINNGKHWVTDSQLAMLKLRTYVLPALDHEIQIRPVAGTLEKL